MPLQLVRVYPLEPDADYENEAYGVPVSQAFVNGYSVAERRAEDIPIRFFHTQDGSIDAEVIIDEDLRKYLMLDVKALADEALKMLVDGDFDCMSSTKEMRDDDISVYNTDLPNTDQAFSCPDCFEIRL